MKLLRWDCCFIVTLVPWASIRHLCPVLYCFQTIMGSQKLVVRTYGQHQSSVQWKSQPKSSWKAFLSMPSVIPWQRKVGKMHQLCNRTLFYPSSLIFAIHTLIISPQHIKTCISLFSRSLWTFCINQCHERSSINSKSYFAEVVCKNLNS